MKCVVALNANGNGIKPVLFIISHVMMILVGFSSAFSAWKSFWARNLSSFNSRIQALAGSYFVVIQFFVFKNFKLIFLSITLTYCECLFWIGLPPFNPLYIILPLVAFVILLLSLLYFFREFFLKIYGLFSIAGLTPRREPCGGRGASVKLVSTFYDFTFRADLHSKGDTSSDE